MVHLLSPAEYQPQIQSRFESVAVNLGSVVPHGQIEHVGASSVPGADSKGDLDICLVVDGQELEKVVSTLRAIGYVEQPHTLRTNQLCMLVWDEAQREHAVQVVAAGSVFMSFLTFRDLLRSRPELVRAYNDVKRSAAMLPEDLYRQRKAEFIKNVLESSLPT